MNTIATNAEHVLELLRRLPPRERLQVLAQVLPELAADLPGQPTIPDFWETTEVAALIAEQQVSPIMDFETLLGGWPQDEPLEPFLAALETWREQNPATENIE